MPTETEHFVFDELVANRIESTEKHSHQQRAPATTAGLRSAKIRCKKCGHAWRARLGDGTLDAMVGAGNMVTCPSCHAVESSIRL